MPYSFFITPSFWQTFSASHLCPKCTLPDTDASTTILSIYGVLLSVRPCSKSFTCLHSCNVLLALFLNEC